LGGQIFWGYDGKTFYGVKISPSHFGRQVWGLGKQNFLRAKNLGIFEGQNCGINSAGEFWKFWLMGKLEQLNQNFQKFSCQIYTKIATTSKASMTKI